MRLIKGLKSLLLEVKAVGIVGMSSYHVDVQKTKAAGRSTLLKNILQKRDRETIAIMQGSTEK